MNYLKHIFYYIFYKKYRILISNIWVWKEVKYPGILDNTIYNSLNGKYSFNSYKGSNIINLFFISTNSFLYIDDVDLGDVSKDVSEFFIMNHKDKLILPEDKLSYKRDKKLKELGI